MPNPLFFKPVFDELAVNGHVGDPNGQPAYAYIRVSGDDQAEEGRSGLPRQILHVHEAACRDGYKVSWEMVFADDHTGFEFEERPELSKLRREFKSPHARADAVVMEHLHRLSRNADWHQGFLLDEMHRNGLKAVFWKSFSSRVERAVMGAIAQDGMEDSKRMMWEGNLIKARSGRVTARTRAYGYKLVDGEGQEGNNAKKMTYYAIFEEEAIVIRIIFRRVRCGDALRKIASDLELAGIKPPKQYKHWNPTQVRLFIMNEVYKGDFYAHRWEHITIQKPSKDGFSTRSVKCKRERPREEWIHVAVPAIVSAEEWEEANRMLEQNKKMARRNAKEPYLLTGVVHCAHCGRIYIGKTRYHWPKNKRRRSAYRGYRCPYNSTYPKYMRELNCQNSDIQCAKLDAIVWKIVSQALLKPDILLSALNNDATSERNRQLEQQIAYLERELESKSEDDTKLLRAYLAEAFDEHEFAGRRKLLKEEAQRMSEELNRLRSQVMTPEQLEQRKAMVLAMSEHMRTQNIPVEPPFELKQRIIKLVVDEIVLDVRGEWLKLDGAIRGIFAIGNTPRDMGWLRLST